MHGSALTHSFVVGWHEQTVDSVERLDAFIDHELVHEWVQLDGSYEESVWLNEGLADYYGVVLPFRAGLLSEEAFLDRVNLQARLGYASLYRNLPLSDLAALYWSDFRAQQEPYYRGFFYLAGVDFALRTRGRTLDDLVGRLRSRHRSGKPGHVSHWRAMVTDELGAEGDRLLDGVLLGSMAPPPAAIWGDAFECRLDEAPVIEAGFDVSTFITGTVTGLRPDGPAALAGLRDGDVLVSMPTYNALVTRAPGQTSAILVRRGTQELTIHFAPGFDTALVPTWRRSPGKAQA
jgi:predicted metalloprotease with PDZ domain